MSVIKALEELRGIAERMDDMAAGESEHGFSPLAISIKNLLGKVEDEIAERFMELPVDADGIPCRIGDVLEWDGGRGEVMAVSDDCVWFDTDAHELRLTCFESSGCRHVQPRTLEDIIYEIALDSMEIVKVVNGTPVLGIDRGQLAEELEIYADEIREITKGGGA